MNSLNRLLSIVFLSLITNGILAQQIGFKTGINFSDMYQETPFTSKDKDGTFNTGFQLGVSADLPIYKLFSIETGILLAKRGSKEKMTFTDQLGNELSSTLAQSIYYLDIPLTGKINLPLNERKRVYALFGPYLGLGLSGNVKIKANTEENRKTLHEDNIIIGKEEESKISYKRLDHGLILGTGIETRNIQIGITYNFGLANISYRKADGVKANHRGLSLSFAYKWGY